VECANDGYCPFNVSEACRVYGRCLALRQDIQTNDTAREGRTQMSNQQWQLDREFEDQIVTDVQREAPSYYSVTREDGWSLGWECDFEPQVGDRARYFGQGVGRPVRGVVCFPKQGGMPLVVRYKSPEEAEAERQVWLANYAKECHERVQRPRVELDGRVFDSEMSEISGFGGDYEEACRKMVLAGMKWLDEHPTADPQFHGYTGIYGVITEDNADAESLTKVIVAASGGGTSGAMHHASVSHVMAYKRLGWDGYRAEMLHSDEGESLPAKG
jgi:hypothetical protein